MKKFMALVVERTSGRVKDCTSFTDEYSWNMSDQIKTLIEAHDLTEVDIIVREASVPRSAQEPGEFETNEPDAAQVDASEDIPF